MTSRRRLHLSALSSVLRNLQARSALRLGTVGLLAAPAWCVLSRIVVRYAGLRSLEARRVPCVGPEELLTLTVVW